MYQSLLISIPGMKMKCFTNNDLCQTQPNILILADNWQNIWYFSLSCCWTSSTLSHDSWPVVCWELFYQYPAAVAELLVKCCTIREVVRSGKSGVAHWGWFTPSVDQSSTVSRLVMTRWDTSDRIVRWIFIIVRYQDSKYQMMRYHGALQSPPTLLHSSPHHSCWQLPGLILL